jgi:hypothetical protein
MNEVQLKIFNAYYIQFLKTIKDISKPKKDVNKTAKIICKAIKTSYSSMDTITPKYLDELNDSGFWEDNTLPVYKGITLQMIDEITKDEYFSKHLVAVLNIFRDEIENTEPVLMCINLMNKPEEFAKKLEEITDEKAKDKIVYLNSIHVEHKKDDFAEKLKDIEETSLGKLAKEIMGDLDIDDIQKSMNGNIFESFKDPNSGLGKVLSSVSQKMLSKISSGELKQESLLTDAIDLAGKLPNMMPEGMASQLGNIGDMLSQLQKMGGSATGGDNPMDMMQQLMKGMNLNKTQKNKANAHFNSSINKTKLNNRLKKKLQKRKENNIQIEIEEDE